MRKSDVFRILSLGFLAGVASVSGAYPWIPEGSLFWIGAGLAIMIGFAFYRNAKAWLVACSLLAFLSGGSLTARSLKAADDVRDQPETEYSGRATVVAEPIDKEKYKELILEPIGKGYSFLAKGSLYDELSYGDVLEVSAKLEIPENRDEKFDYRMYLAKNGVSYVADKIAIRETGERSGSLIFRKILEIKGFVKRRIARSLPVPESGLLEGLILGGSAALPKAVQEDFSRTGLTHIVAVSGYNVTIIAECLMATGILIGLWRQQAFWFAVAGIVLFIVLVGLPASAVRAGIMGTLLLWASKHGRLANAWNAILFAAVAMLVRNPLLLRYDAGFQLSFLATVGIIAVYPRLENRLAERLEKLGGLAKALFEILGLAFSAQVFVLPIILYGFGNLSIVSLLANLMVLPVVTPSMLWGFAAIVAKIVLPPLGTVMMWIEFLMLRYETWIIARLSELPFASIDGIVFPFWGLAIWYIGIIGVMNAGRIRNRLLAKAQRA